jgi:hypothetical protein
VTERLILAVYHPRARLALALLFVLILVARCDDFGTYPSD